VLSGVSDPVGSAFPVRDDVAYPYDRWEAIVNTLVDNVLVANVTQPTAVKDRLIDPIIIGDDYLNSVGRAFEWQVNAISGYAAGDLSCRWGGKKDGVGWLVSGTVTTITGGISLKFDLPKASTSSLTAGYYAWSVEVYTTVGGIEVTRVVGKQPVQLMEKQT
jgi:predicted cobalt transporter CbtA